MFNWFICKNTNTLNAKTQKKQINLNVINITVWDLYDRMQEKV